MSAPLQISTGAPVAQIVCAAAEIALKENSAAQKRATALSAVEQKRSKLNFSIMGNSDNSAIAAMQHNLGEIE